MQKFGKYDSSTDIFQSLFNVDYNLYFLHFMFNNILSSLTRFKFSSLVSTSSLILIFCSAETTKSIIQQFYIIIIIITLRVFLISFSW